MSALNVAIHQFVITFRTILSKEKGATATEYSLLVGLIALIIVAGVTLFGDKLNLFFSSLSTTVGGW